MDIRQVDQLDRYTAAAGHSFYIATRFPENFRDRIAFICEPTGKLVSQFEITAKGAGYVSKQLPNNLYSSGDGWSGPVCAETGPDGAVWIADRYNLIIQHNPTPNKKSAGYDAKNGKGNAYETPLRDAPFGRILRVYPKGSKDDRNPKLVPTGLNPLLVGLAHPNLFWRLQAQRLIVESGSPSAAAKLKEIVNAPGQAAIHAFYTLLGLNALDADTVKAALASSSRGLRLAPSETVGKALHTTLVAGQSTILADATLSDVWQMAARCNATGIILAAASQPACGGNSAAPVLKPNKKLRLHQTSAKGKVAHGLESADCGKFIMACGAGKTFTHELRFWKGLAKEPRRFIGSPRNLALVDRGLKPKPSLVTEVLVENALISVKSSARYCHDKDFFSDSCAPLAFGCRLLGER